MADEVIKTQAISYPHADAGTLRLFGEDTEYKDIPWSVGSNLIMGADGDVREPYNLNTTTSISYLYYQKSNFSLPNGITFAAATNFERAFYQVNGLTFASGVKVCGATNQYEFYGAKNITFTDKVVLTGNCQAMFIDTTAITADIDWTNATVLDSTFGRSRLGTQVGGPDIDVEAPNATDLRQTFERVAGIRTFRLTAPKCIYFNGVVCHMPDLEELYLDLQTATNIDAQGVIGGGRWGVVGGSPKLRKVTIIAPKLTNWYYACQQQYYGVGVEFYGDMSQASSATGMFDKWSLDAASVARIKDTIQAWTSGSHPILLGVDSTLQNDPDVLADIQAIRDKGWSVTLQWNAKV